MDFFLTSDQEALRESIEDFLAKEYPSSRMRAISESESGVDDSLHKQVSELGWPGLFIPEDLGGAGLGFIEAALMFEVLGYHLFSGPLASTAIASAALLLGGTDEQRARILPDLAAGEKTAALALFEGRSTNTDDIAMKASRESDGVVIDGTKLFVVDGATADLFVVALRGTDGIELAVVDASSEGVTVEALPVVDRTRRQAKVGFESVSVPSSNVMPYKEALIDRVRDRASVLIAAEQAGIARRAMEMSIGYAKTRYQFGKPIGVYQAVSHKISDMYLAAEHSTSLVRYASWAADASSTGDLTDTSNAASAVAAWQARVWADDAAFRATADAIQVHGGIGFTWEHDLHMYFKRSRSNRVWLDEPERLRHLISKHAHG